MLGISMRRMLWSYEEGKSEIRDGLDCRWWTFLQSCLPHMGCLPLPNSPHTIDELLNHVEFSGFILTGGDDWGIFPDRDKSETLVFNYARRNRLPILGVCRGAQIINLLSGGTLKHLTGHAGVKHPVFLSNNRERMVNSYHNCGIEHLGEQLESRGVDMDDNVEAFGSANGLVAGIMWHPERENLPASQDQELFMEMFYRKTQ